MLSERWLIHMCQYLHHMVNRLNAAICKITKKFKTALNFSEKYIRIMISVNYRRQLSEIKFEKRISMIFIFIEMLNDVTSSCVRITFMIEVAKIRRLASYPDNFMIFVISLEFILWNFY